MREEGDGVVERGKEGLTASIQRHPARPLEIVLLRPNLLDTLLSHDIASCEEDLNCTHISAIILNLHAPVLRIAHLYPLRSSNQSTSWQQRLFHGLNGPTTFASSFDSIAFVLERLNPYPCMQ